MKPSLWMTIALCLALAGQARTDDAADRKAEAASLVDLAKPQLARGGYFDAGANLKNADAAMLLAGAYRDTGEYAKAIETISGLDKSAAALTLTAELLFAKGDDAG